MGRLLSLRSGYSASKDYFLRNLIHYDKILLFVHFMRQLANLINESCIMGALLRQLFLDENRISRNHEIDEKGEPFLNKIMEQATSHFAEFVAQHSVLSFQYQVHCIRLSRENRASTDKSKLIELVIEALIMAELLERIYRYYLNVPREATRLSHEKAMYRQLLCRYGCEFSSAGHMTPKLELSMSKVVREYTAATNWTRQFLMRFRRFLLALVPLAYQLPSYQKGVVFLDQFAGPVLAHLAWIFFMPRLFINLFLTAKHVIPGWWMRREEADLQWRLRFKVQWQNRWFEIGNDAAWLVSGLLNCFVLVGVLAPVALYVSISLQLYDVVLATIRAHLEVVRMQKICCGYQEMLRDPGLSVKERQDIQDYLIVLDQSMMHEKRRLYLVVLSNSIQLCAFSLALPILALSPIIPLIGALLAVTTTVIIYQTLKYIDKQKPKAEIASLDKVGFFAKPFMAESKEVPCAETDYVISAG